MTPKSSILKIFLTNTQFIVVLLTGLAVTSLVSSSLTLTNYYLNSLGETVISDLGYHTILYISSNKHPWLMENYSALKSSIVDRVIDVYVEIYEVNVKKYNATLKINDAPLNTTIARLVLIYIPGLDENLAYSPHSYLFQNYTVVCGVNVALNETMPVTMINLSVINHLLKAKLARDQYYLREYLDKTYRRYTGISVTPGPRTSPLNYPYPYSRIFNQIVVGELTAENLVYKKYYGTYVGGNVRIDTCSLIIMTGDLGLYKELVQELDSSKWFSSGWITVNDVVFEAGFLETERRDLYYGKILFPIILFDVDALGVSLSIDVSLNRLSDYVRELRLAFRNFAFGVFDSPIHQRLVSMRGSEQIFRYTTVLSILPSLVIVWITASRIPPVLIAILRKTIALLRIRGVSISVIKQNFIYAFLAWLLPGGVIGYAVGPAMGSLLYYGYLSLDNYVESLSKISDPLTVSAVLAIAVILMIGAIKTSFNILSRIEPREFTRPSIFAELPLIERGLSRLSLVVVVIALYYIVRVLFLNPYRMLSGVTEASPLVYVAGFIMMILEPIVILFGPVILVYAIAKIMISYPDKTSRIASKIAGLFTNKYRVLVARFIEVKPARISLAIILSSFAVSLLLGGLTGIDSMKTMFTELRESIYGGIDYVVYKPLIINSTLTRSGLEDYVVNASRYVDGEYTYSFILLGLMGPYEYYKYGGGEIYVMGLYYKYQRSYIIKAGEEKIPLGYLFFVNENFTDVANVPSSYGLNNDFKKSLTIVEKDDEKAIYVYNPVVEEELGLPYSKKPYSGSSTILIGGEHKIKDYDVICSSRNIPVVGGFKDIPGFQIYSTEISFSEVAVIPLYAPKERGVILSMKDFEKYISISLRHGSYVAGYIVLFVKGDVDEDGLDRIGFKVYSLKSIQYSLRNVENYMITGLEFTVSMGVALFLITLVVLGLIAYSIIYENLYSYTLMRGRGISSDEVYGASVAEAFSISLLSILPGFLLGVFLGYGLPVLSVQALSYTKLFTDTAYGVVPIAALTPGSLLVLLLILVLPIAVSLLMVYSVYRRIVREALSLIGGHV